MATLATAVLPATDSQMAFHTPFVSQSVNRKATAIIPTGIYRGFNATALGFTVTIEPDPGTLDSVAVCRTINASLVENHYNVTIRHEGPIVIDYSGVSSYPNTIVLEARYDLTGTAPVEGLTEVRVKVVDPGDVMPYHVVLATVTGPPPIVDVSTADRTGGDLLTPNDLLGTLSVFKMSTMYNNPAAAFSGAFATIAGTTLNFVTDTEGPVVATGNGIMTTAGDGAAELRFVLDGATFGVTTLRIGGQAAVDDGSGQLLANAGGAWVDTFLAVPAGAHTLAIQGGSSVGASVFNTRIVAMHR